MSSSRDGPSEGIDPDPPDTSFSDDVCAIQTSLIQLVSDEKSRINKDIGAQIMQLFAKMTCLTTKQEIQLATLKAQLAEKEKQPSYADVTRNVSREPRSTTAANTKQSPEERPEESVPSVRSGHALLIYLRNPTGNTSHDIKILLKKYFEPQSLGLGEVSMREIRNGIAVQSASQEGLQNLADAIESHPNTKDIFVLKKPTMRKPQFKVQGVDPDVHPAEFLTTLRTQNPDVPIEANEFVLRTSFKERSGNVTHIFEVTTSGYKKLQGKRKLNLGWTSCPISENFYIPKCQKCCTYGHVKKYCSSETEFCPLCAGGHSSGECRITDDGQKRCKACVSRRVEARHAFGSAQCGTYAFHVARLRGRIEYPR